MDTLPQLKKRAELFAYQILVRTGSMNVYADYTIKCLNKTPVEAIHDYVNENFISNGAFLIKKTPKEAVFVLPSLNYLYGIHSNGQFNIWEWLPYSSRIEKILIPLSAHLAIREFHMVLNDIGVLDEYLREYYIDKCAGEPNPDITKESLVLFNIKGLMSIKNSKILLLKELVEGFSSINISFCWDNTSKGYYFWVNIASEILKVANNYYLSEII